MELLYYRIVGRPTVEFDIDEVEYYRSLKFSWTKIANLLGISRSTLYRRLDNEGISRDATFSDISDTDLDDKIVAIKQLYPNHGERMIIGHLVNTGIIVQRARIRASIHRVDPLNTALRRSVTIRRRVYHVEGPNCVWHVDTNHKMIRWRIVVHGGIDGYSRTLVFLHCADNNRALTNLSFFVDAVQSYGLPEKVRTDLGGENVDIWRYMVEQHESEAAVITGSSTHNERIERMWRDVYRCVSVSFSDTFRELEDNGHLDVLNEVDIYCLHKVFLRRVDHSLVSFAETWNNHPLSTEHNSTPNQLFIEGVLQQYDSPAPTTNSSRCNVPVSRDHVQVPRCSFFPCPLLEQEVDHVDVMRDSDSFGADIYREIVRIVGQHLTLGCHDCS